MMNKSVEAIEAEIQKMKARIEALKKETPDSEQDRKVRDATVELLISVISDLRNQQKKLGKRET